ncbi:MAG: T9SS type A sorting domain-containing protein [Bacteroidales bacterium]|nr:T9SS type A sorting domain-containing protein [Bacteroidales bacterium]
MRIHILLGIFLAFASFANAQYTVTDYNDVNVSDGGNVNIELTDNTANNSVHFHLFSSNSSQIIFQVLSSTQPGGATNMACVGIHCYPPNNYTTHTESLDGNNEAMLVLYYNPNGTTETAIVTYKIYESGNQSNAITFSITYTINTGIPQIKTGENLVAFPNPANDMVKIRYNVKESSKLIVYNIVGAQVTEKSLLPGNGIVNIETINLPAGTYFYSLVSESKATETKRLVIKH